MARSASEEPALPSPVDGSVVLRARRERAAAVALLGLSLLLLVGIHWGSLHGQFLSDDFAFPWGVDLASRHAGVWRYVWNAAVVREPQPGNFYRPLGFLSFAFNGWIGGAEPWGWRLFNLVLHVANGALVFRLARRLAGAAPAAVVAAATAGALFWLYPLAPEVSAWVCARFDALALAGLLLCVERHLASRRAFDGAQVASLVAFALALASKESAMTAPAFLFVLDALATPAPSWPARLRRAAWRVLPSLLVLAAYLALRRCLFGGSAVEVYAQSSPLAHLAPWVLWQRFVAMAPIPREALGTLAWPLAIAVGAALAAGAVASWRAGRFVALWLAPALCCGVAVGAVLPHFTGAPPNGEGARLFYLAGAWLALWLALPLAAVPARARHGLAATLLVLLFAAGQAQAMVPWRKAALAMRSLLDAVAAEAPHLRAARQHALLLVPDHWRTAPFARNAQLAPLIPPFQHEDFRDTLAVFTPAAYAEWAHRLHDADLPWSGVTQAEVQLYCFDADAPSLVPLRPDAPTDDAVAWQAAWERALAASACADEFSR